MNKSSGVTRSSFSTDLWTWKAGRPAAKPSKMRFLRRIGWLLVLISTPACAFRKMSFSSSRPEQQREGFCFFLISRWHAWGQTTADWPHSGASGPLPPLKMQMPPSRPSWILFRLSVGLLSVLIHTPAMALSKISLSSMKPRPARRK